MYFAWTVHTKCFLFPTTHQVKMRIGKNAAENWALLDLPGEYWWFHLESFKSPYVIVESRELSTEALYQAALACKDNSKFRNYKNVYVVYTQIANVRRGDVVGECIAHKTKRVRI